MTEFITTKEYKRFVEFCKACQEEQYIGLCYGHAGVGKTLSANHFANWEKVEEEIRRAVPANPNRQALIDVTNLSTIIYTPDVHNTPRSTRDDIHSLMFLFNRLKEKANDVETVPSNNKIVNHVKLLIVDEADRLQPKCLETVRDVYDRYPMGLILIGMPGIEKRLIRFPQLYSRVGFLHAFKPLSKDEVSFILKNQCRKINVEINFDDFSDNESIASILLITNGNFRLINRLLKQAVRIMTVNRLSSITKEVIEAARECLVIGNVY